MSVFDISQLGSILSVWAHPDDETWTAAGVLATAAANRQPVCCVTATRGELGTQDETRWPADQLGKIRQDELHQALAILGISDHKWLDYRDGQCHQADIDQAANKLLPIIESFQPDSVLTFGPSGTTGHPDHIAISNWASKALSKARLKKPLKLYHSVISQEWYEKTGRKLDKKFDIFFNIDKPPLKPETRMDIAFRLPKQLCATKRSALKAQASQTEGIFQSSKPQEIHDIVCFEGFELAQIFYSN